MTWLLVVLGGAVGAPSRYLLDRAISSRARTALPLGTIVVNVLGCLALGAVARNAAQPPVHGTLLALCGVGFCGAFTTFSTFTWETLALFEDGLHRHAVANLAVSVVVGVAAAALGWSVG